MDLRFYIIWCRAICYCIFR